MIGDEDMDTGSCNAGGIAPDGRWQKSKWLYDTLVFINLY